MKILLATFTIAVAFAQAEYHWDLPKGFPIPPVPADNPMTAAKVELGRHLFYDTRMSSNSITSCATCHLQRLAFTDGRTVSIGTTGELHPRNSMSLVNVAYSGSLTWGNPQLSKLEEQALIPMLGAHPIELGLTKDDRFFNVLRADPKYVALFAHAFPSDADPFTLINITKALASFERTIISARSPYDRYHYGGDDSAVSESAKRGEVLFFNQQLHCFRCHGGFNFSDASVSQTTAGRELEYHNTGLYLNFPAPNLGIYEYSRNPSDIGKFKTPTLRNIAVTAPYMHDGSIASLNDVLTHYAAGGRTIVSGPNSGIGHNNPNKDPLISGFELSAQDRLNLIAFLESLTDQELLHDPKFASPW